MPPRPHPPVPYAKVLRLINRAVRFMAAEQCVRDFNRTAGARNTVAMRKAYVAAMAAAEAARSDWTVACEDALDGGA